MRTEALRSALRYTALCLYTAAALIHAAVPFFWRSFPRRAWSVKGNSGRQ